MIPHTGQQLFTKIVKHLLKQNERCAEKTGICQYKLTLDNGRVMKCAVGCLISPKHYSDDIEGQTLETVNKFSGIKTPLVAVEKSIGRALHPNEMILLRQLQLIHDGSPVNRWYIAFQRIAATSGLVMPS